VRAQFRRPPSLALIKNPQFSNGPSTFARSRRIFTKLGAQDHGKLEATIEGILAEHVGPDAYDNDAVPSCVSRPIELKRERRLQSAKGWWWQADTAAQRIITDINKAIVADYGSGYKCATIVEVLHPVCATSLLHCLSASQGQILRPVEAGQTLHSSCFAAVKS
jgi:hypothetical protein